MRLSPFSRGWNRPSSSRCRFSCLNSQSASLLIFSRASGSVTFGAKHTASPAGSSPAGGLNPRRTGDSNAGTQRCPHTHPARPSPLGAGGGEPGSRHRTDAGRLRRCPRIQAGPPADRPRSPPPASHGSIPAPQPPPPQPRIKMEAARRRPLVFVLAARRWPRAERSAARPGR